MAGSGVGRGGRADRRDARPREGGIAAIHPGTERPAIGEKPQADCGGPPMETPASGPRLGA